MGGGRGWKDAPAPRAQLPFLPPSSQESSADATKRNNTNQPNPYFIYQRETKGKYYYEFEFTAKNSRYTRHSVAVVTADKGRFYTLTTGANERRWSKMKDRLNTTVRSFSLVNV